MDVSTVLDALVTASEAIALVALSVLLVHAMLFAYKSWLRRMID